MRYTLIALALVACDGADEDDAPEQCQRLVDALCAKAVECGAPSTASCEDNIEGFPADGCASAKRIRDRAELNACIATIPTVECSAGTPESCAGQVVFP